MMTDRTLQHRSMVKEHSGHVHSCLVSADVPAQVEPAEPTHSKSDTGDVMLTPHS